MSPGQATVSTEVSLSPAGHGLSPRQGDPAQGPQVQECLLRQRQSGDHRLRALQHFWGAAGWQVSAGWKGPEGFSRGDGQGMGSHPNGLSDLDVMLLEDHKATFFRYRMKNPAHPESYMKQKYSSKYKDILK